MKFSSSGEQVIDYVIITALEKEQQALLKYVDSFEEYAIKSGNYYRAIVKSRINNTESEIIAISLNKMGNINAAITTTKAIDVWNPSYVILAGIAGGIKDTNRYLGDVIVGEQVLYYELGKQNTNEIERRYEVYRPAQPLIQSAKQLPADKWALSIQSPRPDGKTGRVIPTVHFGVVASGEKVVKDPILTKELSDDWSQLVGIEMEGAGTALSAYESNSVPGVLLAKGICDWADTKKNDLWQQYAAETSAAYITNLMRYENIPLTHRPQPARKVEFDFSGKVKLTICRRLTNDWQDLADYFDIKPYQRARFERGREPHDIWVWLEEREKLGALPEALKEIDREDLLQFFESKL